MEDPDRTDAEEFLKRFADYMSGEWQKRPPMRSGSFYVRTADGGRLGIRELYYSGDTPRGTPVYKDRQRDQGCKGVTDWAGEWWSHPIPRPPTEA